MVTNDKPISLLSSISHVDGEDMMLVSQGVYGLQSNAIRFSDIAKNSIRIMGNELSDNTERRLSNLLSRNTLRQWTDYGDYTVTFVNDGAIVRTMKVNRGEDAIPPELYRQGYSLSWDKPYVNIQQDTVITAIWTVNRYIVTTEVQPSGYGTIYGGGEYDYGEEVVLCAVPQQQTTGDVYRFSNWDGDVGYSTQDTVTIVVSSNIDAIGRFTKEETTYTVTFHLNGGNIGGSTEDVVETGISYGQTIADVRPIDPSRDDEQGV